MSRTTLVLGEDTYQQLLTLAASPQEQALVLIVGRSDDGDTRLLVRDLVGIEDAAVAVRTSTELEIRSDGYMPALRLAADMGAGALFVHTHPNSDPRRSRRDEVVDKLLEPTFINRTGVSLYGSVVAAVADGSLAFTGRWRSRRRWRAIDRMWIIGDRLRLLSAADASAPAPPPAIFDRQVRAFGPMFQRLLGQLSIAVVGTGGTGSATAEQLARMGVGRLLLIDDDVVSDTNLTRIHEVTRSDVGKPKVEALARRLRSIGTGTEVVPLRGRVTELSVARRLRSCDLVFGCTDDELGRAVLVRLAYRYLAPVIDCAVKIGATDGAITEVIARVTIMLPGHPCLLCRGRIDSERMRLEGLGADERAALEAERYVEGLPDTDPSVMTFTTLAASLAVSEMTERIVGYAQPPEPPTELLALMHDRRILRSRVAPDAGSRHVCVRPDRWGMGDVDDDTFLGTTWAS